MAKTIMTPDDAPGWYEITYFDALLPFPEKEVQWWNGKHFLFNVLSDIGIPGGGNEASKRGVSNNTGWTVEKAASNGYGILSIVRLVPAGGHHDRKDADRSDVAGVNDPGQREDHQPASEPGSDHVQP